MQKKILPHEQIVAKKRPTFRALYCPVDMLAYTGLKAFSWYELPPGCARPTYEEPKTKRWRNINDEAHFSDPIDFNKDDPNQE